VSDSKKPGGSRDISDLKARLGLKKGAAAPAAAGPAPRANGTTGGVVAPPGLNLPPPPGLAPPEPVRPAAPPPPNAHEDPFGAMNHMAAVGTVQRAPEIVIVNDGKPVENVGAESSGASIAKIAIPAALALIVGIVVGKIGAQNGSYNAGIGDIKGVLGAKGTPSTVADLKSQLSVLDTKLDEQKTNGFKVDKALDDALADFAKKADVKDDIIFRAKMNSINPEVAGKILSFYAGVTEIKSMIDIHMKSAKYDEMAFKKAKDGKDAGTLKDTDNAGLAGQFKYAVYLQAPTETDKTADFGAKLVEIGPPYCGEKIASSGKCADGNSPTGYTYRAEPGGAFTQGDLASGGQDTIPTKKLVMLLPGGVRDSLVQGADGVASQALYQRRVRAIYERIHGDGKNQRGLLEDGNKLESALQQEASRGKKFSFFM
jgi:hypothetical protein